MFTNWRHYLFPLHVWQRGKWCKVVVAKQIYAGNIEIWSSLGVAQIGNIEIWEWEGWHSRVALLFSDRYTAGIIEMTNEKYQDDKQEILRWKTRNIEITNEIVEFWEWEGWHSRVALLFSDRYTARNIEMTNGRYLQNVTPPVCTFVFWPETLRCQRWKLTLTWVISIDR